MSTSNAFSLAQLTDLDRVRYLEMALMGFSEQSRWDLAIATDPNRRKFLVQGRQCTWTRLIGLNTPVTAAVASGTDFAYTTPTDAQIAGLWATYPKAVQIDQQTETGSVVEVMNSSMSQLLVAATSTYDYLACTAAIAATNNIQVNSHATAAIVAADIMAVAYARKAYAYLEAGHAPKFNIPGIGPTYLAYVHPHVAYDLKVESSGIFTGVTNVNAPNYVGNVLGQAAGFLWIETSSQGASLVADGGSSTCDLYHTIFLSDQALGMVHGPVPTQPGAIDIALNPERSIIGRMTFPHTKLGMQKELGMIANIGFKIVDEAGVWRVESSSSLGANT